MKSIVIFFKDGKEIGEGRWDGRANERTAPEQINWNFCSLDFDEAVCRNKSGKRIIVLKKKPPGRM